VRILILVLALGTAAMGQTSGTITTAPLQCKTVPAGDGCNSCRVCGGTMTSCTLAYCMSKEEVDALTPQPSPVTEAPKVPAKRYHSFMRRDEWDYIYACEDGWRILFPSEPVMCEQDVPKVTEGPVVQFLPSMPDYEPPQTGPFTWMTPPSAEACHIERYHAGAPKGNEGVAPWGSEARPVEGYWEKVEDLRIVCPKTDSAEEVCTYTVGTDRTPKPLPCGPKPEPMDVPAVKTLLVQWHQDCPPGPDGTHSKSGAECWGKQEFAWTCTDKSRILLTSEDGKKWCHRVQTEALAPAVKRM